MNKQMNRFSFLSFLLVVMLLAAMLLTTTSCDKNTNTGTDTENVSDTSEAYSARFTFEVIFADGSKETFYIETDKTTVGEALVDEGLISGDNSQYGLYVYTVCGEYHKYEEDGKYWAFYINGDYGMTGVDKTEIIDDATYSFRAE